MVNVRILIDRVHSSGSGYHFNGSFEMQATVRDCSRETLQTVVDGRAPKKQGHDHFKIAGWDYADAPRCVERNMV